MRALRLLPFFANQLRPPVLRFCDEPVAIAMKWRIWPSGIAMGRGGAQVSVAMKSRPAGRPVAYLEGLLSLNPLREAAAWPGRARFQSHVSVARGFGAENSAPRF
jgi:hypothetical protein